MYQYLSIQKPESTGTKKKRRLTPSEAIRKECRWCKNGSRFECESKLCKLNPDVTPTLTPLKRIKTHCIDCVGSESELKNCGGDKSSESRGRTESNTV